MGTGGLCGRLFFILTLSYIRGVVVECDCGPISAMSFVVGVFFQKLNSVAHVLIEEIKTASRCDWDFAIVALRFGG